MINRLTTTREKERLKEKIAELKKYALRLKLYGNSHSDYDNYLDLKHKIETFKRLLHSLENS